MSQSRECLYVTGRGQNRAEALADADRIAEAFYGKSQAYRTSGIGPAQVDDSMRTFDGTPRFTIEVTYTPVLPF